MNDIPGSIKAARLKQPRLTSAQVWRQVEQHLGISLSKSVLCESGENSPDSCLQETPSQYQVSDPGWSSK